MATEELIDCQVCFEQDGLPTKHNCYGKCKYYICQTCEQNTLRCIYNCHQAAPQNAHGGSRGRIISIPSNMFISGNNIVSSKIFKFLDRTLTLVTFTPTGAFSLIGYIILSLIIFVVLIMPCVSVAALTEMHTREGFFIATRLTFPLIGILVGVGITTLTT